MCLYKQKKGTYLYNQLLRSGFEKNIGGNICVKIFVLNCGSSSIKYQLINYERKEVLISGILERIGTCDSILRYKTIKNKSIEVRQPVINHNEGLELILQKLIEKDTGIIKHLSDIDAFGHRVVHGGEIFYDATIIDDTVLTAIKKCIPMAPLHNPANLLGITTCMRFAPKVPHIAVFDTAFHHTIPKKAFLYGLPYSLYLKYGLRKYGFHGISHQYVANKASIYLKSQTNDLRIVTCHLGNGASIAAVQNGVSIDTSMGFTPLAGLVMGTRCGEIDPAVIPFIMEKEDMTGKQVYSYLNQKAGVLGISEVSSDFRDLERAAMNGDKKAQLAIDIFVYRVKQYIGAYSASMGGIDCLVFTAGLGENSEKIRASICEGLDFLGINLDLEKNKLCNGEITINVSNEKVKILVIPTNEELVIAQETVKLCVG